MGFVIRLSSQVFGAIDRSIEKKLMWECRRMLCEEEREELGRTLTYCKGTKRATFRCTLIDVLKGFLIRLIEL